MLLGDTDVVAALGEGFGEPVEPGAGRHRRGDRHDLLVGLRLLDQRIGEHLGEARRADARRLLRSGHDIEPPHAMELVGGILRVLVALALLGDDVDQDRAVLRVAHIAQDREQMIEIMPIDWTDIIEAELLEQRAAGPEASCIFLGARGATLPGLGQDLGELLRPVAELLIGLAGYEARKIGAHGADRGRDRHIVVVEDDDQARIHRASIIHRLIGHAGAHGAVADDRDHVVLLAGEVAGDRHAEPGRDRGGGVARAENVVFALVVLAEAGEAAAHAQGADAVAPPGQDLVRICLMADVPDELVIRGVEHLMQSDGELDHAKARAEVTAGHRHRVDGLLAKLRRELRQLVVFEGPKVLGRHDG